MTVSRILVLLALSFTLLCAGQTAPAPSNPRAGADDPRVGLKAGLYDAGEAAFGLQRIVSLPKPPGFAPGNDATATTAASATPAEGGDQALRPTGGSYGSTNSDLAFQGKLLFV